MPVACPRRMAICLLVLACLSPARTGAQDHLGKPLIQNFDRPDVITELQHWAVAQDERGILYFANNAGVLEYDGQSWRLIELPSRGDVRSVAIAPGGRAPVYVGALGDFGHLEPDEVGRLRFTSLLPAEAKGDPSFDQYFTAIVVSPDRVYFKGGNKLCRFDGSVRCRDDDALGASRLFPVAGRVYAHDRVRGLVELVDGRTVPVPGGDRLAGLDITVMLAAVRDGHERLIVGTRDFRFFIGRGGVFTPAHTQLYDPAGRDQLTSGAILPDGRLALGTVLRGLLIVDDEGAVLQRVDERLGLRDSHVLALLVDRQGGLWTGLQHGVSRIAVSSSLSTFDESSGLQREWREVLEYHGMLYARGYKGLFAAPLPAGPNGQPGRARDALRFTRIDAIKAPSWAWVIMQGRLLVSALDGVYEVSGTRAHRVMPYASIPWVLYAAQGDPALVYVGLEKGVAMLRLANGVWRDEGVMPHVDGTITSIADGDDGDLWLVSHRQRVLRVMFEGGRVQRVHAYPLGEPPLTGRIAIQQIGGKAVFLTEEAILEFDAPSGRFVPFRKLAALAGSERQSFAWIVDDHAGNIWVASRKPARIDLLRKQEDGSFVLHNPGLQHTLAWSIYPRANGNVVWVCTPDYLLRYDVSTQPGGAAAFATQLRQVSANDTVLYGGMPIASVGDAHVPSAARAVRFEFAAPRFDEAGRNEFQSYLEGFDAQWSAWSTGSSRIYTNLPKGTYRFVVRARDGLGRVGAAASFAFTVPPAWYQTGWAYASYIALVCLALVLISHIEWRRAQFEIQRRLEQLELEQLRDLDHLKSRFFADISHELRTPLTLILGPVSQMLSEVSSQEFARPLRLVRRNAQYLLRLISQLLDLSKLEAGKMRLHASRGDLSHTVGLIVTPFVAAAESRGVTLTVEVPAASSAAGDVYFDADVLQKILNNLVGNACKFTPSGGAVTVAVRAADTGFVSIAVSDTGPGIPVSDHARVFDRFYQVEGERSREGIGIGLALVKELVELQHGEIDMVSEPGQGTTFTVRLRTGSAHLDAAEIVPNMAMAAVTPEPGALDVLPLERADESLAADAAEASDDDTTVLIVEDHVEVRTFLRDHLERHYRVLEADNGAKGLEQAMAALPDLVISDVVMTAMDGYELCRALKTHEKTCHIPVILLTAKAAREDKLQGLETGADCYLIKPFDALELLLQVRNLIDQRRHLRERFSGPVVLKPSELGVTPMDEAFLQKVLAAIQAHMQDPTFDVERLGREVGLSRSQLHRKLRALTNQPPTLLIRSIRLQRAAELLAHKTGSVAEVAYFVGFNSQAYFAKCFREQFGCSPREYAPEGAANPPVPFRPIVRRRA